MSTGDAARSAARRKGARGEVRLFRLALALVAVAVLDDAFLAPEPGASAADHLASGLVPVAVAALLALAYPYLREGLRAAVALACGVLAIVGGVCDGVRHVLVDGLAGDDLTAVLAALAGAGLLALGARTLWRSRRLDESRPRRYLRRALVGAAALLVALELVVPVGLAIVATHKARSPVAAADLGRPYASVALRTRDGRRLAGWYVPSRNRAAILAFPGRSGPVARARLLARHGYGVLLIDRGGEGASEGDLNLYGWNGEQDVRAALAFLRARRDVDPGRIGGLGLSVGGELLLQTAAHTDALRAVVSEGAGARSIAEHRDRPSVGSLGRLVTPWWVQTAALRVLSDTSPPPGLTGLVARIAPRPVLLISARDGHADEELNRVYARAIGPSASLWELPDGGHTGALAAHPAEFERILVDFFDRALRR